MGSGQQDPGGGQVQGHRGFVRRMRPRLGRRAAGMWGERRTSPAPQLCAAAAHRRSREAGDRDVPGLATKQVGWGLHSSTSFAQVTRLAGVRGLEM